MELRCVECGFSVEKLYVQYSPGNIRLMKCLRCNQVADEYIECEIMIPLIDLILHKPKAYRHLLHNVLNRASVNLEMVIDVLLGNFSFFAILVSGLKLMRVQLDGVFGHEELLLAILISSYLKIFLVSMMIWDFPIAVMFLIDVFIISSNSVALTVMTQEPGNKCAAICFAAHAAKILTNYELYIQLLNSSR